MNTWFTPKKEDVLAYRQLRKECKKIMAGYKFQPQPDYDIRRRLK